MNSTRVSVFLPRQPLWVCVFILFVNFLFAQTPIRVDLPPNSDYKAKFDQAVSIRYDYPDSTVSLFNECYEGLLQVGDTLNAIYVLAETAKSNGHLANYKNAYDKLWTALLLADEANLAQAKACIYTDIGRYYSFYKRNERAFEYFNLSLQINRGLVKKQELEPAVFADNYYAFSKTHRELGDIERSQQFLDSCFYYHDPELRDIKTDYLNVEKDMLLREQKNYGEALQILKQTLPWLQKNDPGYQVLVSTYLGDIYSEQGNYSESETHYKNAIEISDRYKRHIDFTPLVHEKLSKLYYKQGQVDRAYQQLWTMKDLDERFFDSRSENNRPLLEILDAFRLEKETQRELLQQQRLEQLEHEERVYFLQRTILIISLVSLLLIGWGYLKYVRSKHRAEKKLIREKQKLEIEKTNEIIELKNKELSASTLKLIEKDEFISTLRDKISNKKGQVDLREIKRYIRTMSAGNEQNWQEFEARFIAVNKGFYERLKDGFPKLTQGDLKLCALIKLNFSSKDMARLMGISVESVHTTRYRLRKKLALSRAVNLTEFIADI